MPVSVVWEQFFSSVYLTCSKLPSFQIFKNLTAVKRVPLGVMVALSVEFYPKANVFQKN